MKILILTDFFPPYFRGGYELQCKLQAEELARRGHTVYILTSRWQVGEGRIEDNIYRLLHYNTLDGGLLIKRNSPDPLRLRKRYNQLKWAISCRRNYGITREIVKTLKPDVAFIWNMGGLSITPVLAVQEQNIPAVFILYDYWLALLKTELFIEPNWLKRRYRAAIVGLRDFDHLDLKHILVNSQSMMRSYVDLGFPEQNISVIPLGIPSRLIINFDELSDPHQNSEGKVHLVFVGRLVPPKGPDVAIEALAHLVREEKISDISLDIIGTGPEEYVRKLRDSVSAWELQNHVEFVGKLEHQQVLDRYKSYNALLFTSLWKEPFSMTVLEAMAQGLPVIATDRGGTPEVVSDGETGLLVPPGDSVMLARAVSRFLREAALAHKIRFAALKTIRDHYSLERIVDQIEEELHMVLPQARTVSAQGV